MPIVEPKNLQEFNQLINNSKLVVVDFHATWCGPCKLIAPKFAKLVDVYPDVVFAKVDVDEVADVASHVSVRAMPTFMYFINGNKVDEVVGASLKDIEDKIKTHSA
ncbi:thioredoxin-like protein [Radiomyces spectabilis]|uniref:thioredoxin-like protein n=1 Tax=Radiomyces spectabilis TaxID=64574 RepID=UPI002220451B|nr:thioredoxin-like protein [Radiomyces spectabilis]KAI8374448.1 thioredoxin-like protein [Radiomyces spectabilis]